MSHKSSKTWSTEKTYVTIKKNGVIEGVNATLVKDNDIPGKLLEEQLKKSIKQYLQIPLILGISEDLIFKITFTGISGYILHYEHKKYRFLDKEQDLLTETVFSIQDDNFNTDSFTKLFKQIFNNENWHEL